jgi:hypothetical protein
VSCSSRARQSSLPLTHVLTVHWKSDQWIDLQLGALERHAQTSHRVYAFLDEVSVDHVERFYYTATSAFADHATKLNDLAGVASQRSESDEDVLLFIDGDAVPVCDLTRIIRKLGEWPLIAVRRLENNGDPQPHPSFCLTTVGFWREIRGDWRDGPVWCGSDGNDATDVGARLLRALADRSIAWKPLDRLNRLNPHPVFFGVYGDQEPVVYHHGAGFRAPFTRVDLADDRIDAANRSLRRRLFDPIPDRPPFKRVRHLVHPWHRAVQLVAREQERQQQMMFERISSDPDGWRDLV